MRNSELLYKLDCIFVGANFFRPQAYPSGEGEDSFAVRERCHEVTERDESVRPTEGLVDEENIDEFVL